MDNLTIGVKVDSSKLPGDLAVVTAKVQAAAKELRAALRRRNCAPQGQGLTPAPRQEKSSTRAADTAGCPPVRSL